MSDSFLKLCELPFWYLQINSISATEYSSEFVSCAGQARVEGLIQCGAPGDAAVGTAPGYPRVEFSDDGVQTKRYVMIQADGAAYATNGQGVVYPIDLRCLGKFVRVKFKQSSGNPQALKVSVSTRPDGAGAQ